MSCEIPAPKIARAAESPIIRLSAQGDCPYAAPGRGKLCDDGVQRLVQELGARTQDFSTLEIDSGNVSGTNRHGIQLLL